MATKKKPSKVKKVDQSPKKLSNCVVAVASCKIYMLEKYAAPLANFVARLYLAWVFLKSGIHKVNYWDSAVNLFKYEHPVPFLSPELAALLGTGTELICGIMLILGLGTRFAATILFMTVVLIEFTYMSNVTHHLWMLLLAMIITYGPDKLALDFCIRKRYLGDQMCDWKNYTSCVSCTKCENCSNCTNCKKCENCNKCENCTKCEKCK